MTFNEIEQTLGQWLEGMADAPPIAWPNKDYNPQDGLPYVEFRHVPTIRTDDSIDGGHEVQTGIVLLTVVTERDKFTTQAATIGQAIANRFSYGLRIAGATGDVMVSKPVDPVAGFVDGVYWRQPVRITYRTAPSL